MKTLMMDTAWKNLVVALFEDGKLVAGTCHEAFKKQSEQLFVELKKLLERAGWSLKDLDEVIITDGPGSYTGLRIAMTAAKILATQQPLQLRTISTLQLYAGTGGSANVLLDARGGRVYAGHVEDGFLTWSGILPVESVPAFLEEHPGILYGEGELAGLKSEPSDFLGHAADLLKIACPVENVHALVPRYMKESDSYRV